MNSTIQRLALPNEPAIPRDSRAWASPRLSIAEDPAASPRPPSDPMRNHSRRQSPTRWLEVAAPERCSEWNWIMVRSSQGGKVAVRGGRRQGRMIDRGHHFIRAFLVLVLSIAVLVLVLGSIQYSNPTYWSASSREPPRSTIGIAAVLTAIEYEYRFTEYRPPRRTEYEYDEIRCEARSLDRELPRIRRRPSIAC